MCRFSPILTSETLVNRISQGKPCFGQGCAGRGGTDSRSRGGFRPWYKKERSNRTLRAKPEAQDLNQKKSKPRCGVAFFLGAVRLPAPHRAKIFAVRLTPGAHCPADAQGCPRNIFEPMATTASLLKPSESDGDIRPAFAADNSARMIGGGL